jgi:Tfp pilus assembly protein PilN
MADIDMIPRSYREAVRARRLLAAYGTGLALLLAAGCGASALLRWRLAVATPQLERLRAATAQAEAMRAQVVAAQQRKDALAQDVQALAALRGVGSVAVLSGALDAALNDKVWFDQLQFARTQELLRDPLPQGALQVRVAARGGAPAAVQAWRLASHVEIAGQALDNAAMTTFLAAMSASPVLDNVRFLNSSSQAAGDQPVVAFSVAGSLRLRGGGR